MNTQGLYKYLPHTFSCEKPKKVGKLCASRRIMRTHLIFSLLAETLESTKGPVPKTRKFKSYVQSEKFTSDKESPKEHFSQKMRKNVDPYYKFSEGPLCHGKLRFLMIKTFSLCAFQIFESHTKGPF